MNSRIIICGFCGKEIKIVQKIRKNDTCPYCFRDIHCCINCKFYKETAHNKCLEPAAEFVRDKERRNFCEYFEIGEGNRVRAGDDSNNKTKEIFEGLFKKR